jgi:hypothetical protein
MATEKFHYTSKAGDKIVLPKFDQIPTGVIRRTRNLLPEDQMFAVLEAYLGDESPEMAAVDNLPTGELQEFVAAWQKDAGLTVGESSAS